MPKQLPNGVAHELIAAEGRTGLTAALRLAIPQLNTLFSLNPVEVEVWFKLILDSDSSI